MRWADMARISLSEALSPNVPAFLDTIKFSELGAALITMSDDGYNVIVGSTPKAPKLFTSYADHPRKLIDLPNLGIKSTAAGAYQFIVPTWDPLRAKLGLSDFSPINQDRAAIELLHQHGALVHILAGDIPHAAEIAAAIALNAPVWASLPGAGYGQHENKMEILLKAFGGYLAHYENLPEAMGL